MQEIEGSLKYTGSEIFSMFVKSRWYSALYSFGYASTMLDAYLMVQDLTERNFLSASSKAIHVAVEFTASTLLHQIQIDMRENEPVLVSNSIESHSPVLELAPYALD